MSSRWDDPYFGLPTAPKSTAVLALQAITNLRQWVATLVNCNATDEVSENSNARPEIVDRSSEALARLAKRFQGQFHHQTIEQIELPTRQPSRTIKFLSSYFEVTMEVKKAAIVYVGEGLRPKLTGRTLSRLEESPAGKNLNSCRTAGCSCRHVVSTLDFTTS